MPCFSFRSLCIRSSYVQDNEKARAADGAKAGRVDIVYADLTKDTE